MPPIPELKYQPWILYDTVAANSFLIGDNTDDGKSIGGKGPAISRNGEIIFFNSRDTESNPQLTNLDIAGQLSYGMEVWQAYLMLKFPGWDARQTNLEDPVASPLGNIVGPGMKLAECILHLATLRMKLGQEEQTEWSTHRFSAGGGLWTPVALAGTNPQNAVPSVANVMKFPEPIEMPRTQNFGAKIRLAPETLPIIGERSAPGVGIKLSPYNFLFDLFEGAGEQAVELQNLPYAIEFGLVGRRVKRTQYGQEVRAEG